MLQAARAAHAKGASVVIVAASYSHARLLAAQVGPNVESVTIEDAREFLRGRTCTPFVDHFALESMGREVEALRARVAQLNVALDQERDTVRRLLTVAAVDEPGYEPPVSTPCVG